MLEAIDNVLGKMLAFKLKVTPGSTNFSDNQISKDAEIIKSILEKIPSK